MEVGRCLRQQETVASPASLLFFRCLFHLENTILFCLATYGAEPHETEQRMEGSTWLYSGTARERVLTRCRRFEGAIDIN